MDLNTHGSPELDEDALKLEMMGADPGPTLADIQPVSPFLPDTHIQYAWDSTCLGLFKTCPRLYQYTMIEGWSPKTESVHLRFGSEFHSALEHYDHTRCEGFNHDDSLHEAVRYALEHTWIYPEDDGTTDGLEGWSALPNLGDKATRYKNRQTLIELIIDYLDHFGESDPAQTITLANGKPAVELSFRIGLEYGPNPDQPYILCGHLDRLVNFNSEILVMDRKTTTTALSDYYFRQYEPNNQMTLYTIAGQVLWGSPVRGVIIDACQILLEKPHNFARGFTFRTEDQISEWLIDLRLILELAEYYATANYWPMNDTACDKFGGCKFREICSKSPSVRETFLKSDFNQLPLEERWNPMKPR